MSDFNWDPGNLSEIESELQIRTLKRTAKTKRKRTDCATSSRAGRSKMVTTGSSKETRVKQVTSAQVSTTQALAKQAPVMAAQQVSGQEASVKPTPGPPSTQTQAPATQSVTKASVTQANNTSVQQGSGQQVSVTKESTQESVGEDGTPSSERLRERLDTLSKALVHTSQIAEKRLETMLKMHAAATKNSYEATKRVCLLNLFALYTYGHIDEARRYQQIMGSTSAFSSQDINMARFAYAHMPTAAAQQYVEQLEEGSLRVLKHWHKKKDRRFIHYLAARSKSIIDVFGNQHEKCGLSWFPRVGEKSEAYDPYFMSQVKEQWTDLIRIEQNHGHYIKSGQMANASKTKGEEDLRAEDCNGSHQALDELVLSAQRQTELLSQGLHAPLLNDACIALDSVITPDDVTPQCTTTTTAADVKLTIEVSLLCEKDVALWKAVKSIFGDLFAGGLTSFEADEEELRHYCIM